MDPRPRRVPKKRPGQKGGKRDENRRRRTRDLCEAATDLFLAKGLDAVTIDDIAKAGGVAKGSFYRYFEDKTDLVEAIFGPITEKLEAAFEGCEQALAAASSVEEHVQAYQLLGAELTGAVILAPSVAQLYIQENRGPATGARAPLRRLADRIDRRAIELTEVAHRKKLLRRIDPRLSALAVVGAIEKLTFGFFSGREDLGDVALHGSELISLVLDGLRPR